MTLRSIAALAVLALAATAPIAAAQDKPAKPPAESAKGKPSLPDAEDVKHVPALDLRAKGDDRMRYALIGLDPDSGTAKRNAPKDGYKLLLVLPGGDGTMEFHTFVKRVLDRALAKDWLIAQLERPLWDAKQAEVKVWPTKTDPWPGQAFAVEEFADAVIADARKRAKIDPAFVFTLTWSSSGPAGYAIQLRDDSPITGSFVAMSVFYEANLPPLDRAAKKAFYILHSKEDEVCNFELAETARDALTKKKADVDFATYEGGHRWPDDVFGSIRTGIAWLEKHHSKPPKR